MRPLLPDTTKLLFASTAAKISLSTLPPLITISGFKSILGSDDLPTGTYESVTTTITVSTTDPADMTPTTLADHDNITSTISKERNTTPVSTSDSVTLLVGTTSTSHTRSVNGTKGPTSTSTSTRPTNTQPCNGYVEFCARNYSNITNVAAHNSPFVRPGNVAANQMFPVTTQLNDGIRMRESHFICFPFWPPQLPVSSNKKRV